MVLTLTWYFGAWIVAVTVCVAELQPVRPAGQQFLVGHPDDGRLELIRHLRRVIRDREDVAADAIDLIGEA